MHIRRRALRWWKTWLRRREETTATERHRRPVCVCVWVCVGVHARMGASVTLFPSDRCRRQIKRIDYIKHIHARALAPLAFNSWGVQVVHETCAMWESIEREREGLAKTPFNYLTFDSINFAVAAHGRVPQGSLLRKLCLRTRFARESRNRSTPGFFLFCVWLPPVLGLV